MGAIGNIIGGVTGDIAEASGAQSSFQATAPTVDATQLLDPTLEENKRKLAEAAAAAEARTAPAAAAPTGPTAATIGRTGRVGAPGTVTAPTLAPAAQATATGVGPAATIAQDPQAQFRAQQAEQARRLAATAAGTGGPSAAELQLQRGSEANIRNQLATAASAAPGANPAAVARQTGRNIAQEGQVLNEQQAILRAQETAGAEQLLTGATAGARETDVGIATQQAAFQQQATLQQAEIDHQTNMANLESQRQQAIQAGDQQLAASLANQQAALTANIEQVRLDTQTSIRQAELAQEASIVTAQLAQSTELANLQAQLQTQEGIDRLTQFYTAAGLSLDAAQFQAQQDAEALRVGGQTSAQQINAQTAAGNAAVSGQIAGGLIGGIGAAGAAAASDIRAKTEISRGEGDIRAILDKVRPYAFRYKDPKAPGTTDGRLVGVMAQDLEKSDGGKEMIRMAPDGTMMVDMVRAVSASLSASGDLHHRMKALESSRKVG